MINLSALLLGALLALILTAYARDLIVLHTLDGRAVTINPAQVTHLIAALADQPNVLLVEGVQCVINLSDGKRVTVTESCDAVRKLLEEAKR